MAVPGGAGIRAHRDSHARSQRLGARRALNLYGGFRFLHHVGLDAGLDAVSDHQVDRGRRRDQPDVAFQHHFDALVVEKIGMFDALHAGPDAVPDPGRAMRVNRGQLARLVGFLDRGAHFRLLELRRADLVALGQDPAGRHQLDAVRAGANLFAGRPARVVRPVGLAAELPAMAAGHCHRLAAEDQTRRGRRQAFVHRPPEGNVDMVLGAQIAHRGNAGRERPFGISRHAQDRHCRGIAHDLTDRIGVAVDGKMNVAVDHARHDRPARNVDHFPIRRGGEVRHRPNAGDRPAFDDDEPVGQDLPGPVYDAGVGEDASHADASTGSRAPSRRTATAPRLAKTAFMTESLSSANGRGKAP